MKIIFKKLKAHGFLSLGDVEVDLKDRGYVLVSGINNCAKDNAKSNGSGKSSIWSAICFALTGETIQGMSSDLVNVNYDGNCSVELEFNAEGTEYRIVRYKAPKADMKIYVNNEDKSGKGIRESEAVLAQYLPDLTAQLIGSVIILGQGLPQKFSNNSPSGRKDVLEKLSKSDFMIEDIKLRIANRSDILNQKLRVVEDNLLIDNSKKITLNESLDKKKVLRDSTVRPDFDKLITEEEAILEKMQKAAEDNSKSKSDKESLRTQLQESLTDITTEKTNKLNELMRQKTEHQSEVLTNKTELDAKVKSLKAEIQKLDSITDICPTCGQKLIGVTKPDTTAKKAELETLKAEQAELDIFIEEDNKNFYESYNKCDSQYNLKLNDVREKQRQINADLLTVQNLENQLRSSIISETTALNKLKLDKENFDTNLSNLIKEIDELTKNISDLNEKIANEEKEKLDITDHLDVITKMNTLVKRDFRGFLLSNVIDYINKKAKEYCAEIFNTNEIEFALDGNNISIMFCNKNFDGLSGGEKQRIDLILQFAIRDMMCNYLGFSSNILVLDEIFDNLDSKACSNVINFISTKLLDVNSLFIVSHHADELAIPYDSELIIEKNEEGVSYVK